jgi:ABC-type sugar transport system substrate-binding protein
MKAVSATRMFMGVAALLGSAVAVTAARAADPPKLVYFIFTGYAYPYFAPMAEAVKQAAAHYPDMQVRIVNADNSPSQEITDIKEAQAAGAKGIILNVVQESVTGAAQQALQSGIPLITLDRDVSELLARDAFIGDNDETLGQEEAQNAIDTLRRNGVAKPWHVVVLQGTLGASPSIGRLKGTMDVLTPLVKDGSVDIILNQSADFATEQAQATMSAELARTTNIQLVISANDAMALGVINAIKTHGLTPGKQVLVAGADAQPESLDAVRSGEQLNTVTHSPFVESYWGVEAMDNLLASGTKPPTDKFPNGEVTIPMTLVTEQNAGQISAWGTPASIPPLPYGVSQSYPVAPGK